MRWEKGLLVGISLVGSLVGESSALYGASQVPAELLAIQFTTPEQEVFTLGVAPGGLAYIQNAENGIEYALSASPLPPGSSIALPGDATPKSSAPSKKERQIFQLKLFQLVSSAEGTAMKELASTKALRPGEEFLEPISGLRFRILALVATKSPPEDPTHLPLIRAGCCVDCGSYVSCAMFVSACGQVCNKDVPFGQLGVLANSPLTSQNSPWAAN